jgi:hypothetical protein
MAYDKLIARSDRISIDGTDVSNSFRQFGLSSVDSEEDVSGFSETGNDETLPGSRAQGFSGEAFYSEDLASLLVPLHLARTLVEIQWQPNGLVDGSAGVYYAICTINEFSPSNTRGSASTTPFTAKTADATGVTFADGT